jgi:prefoldin subunit 5
MEQEKMRVRPNTKQSLRRYLFPITIVSSILISGSVGYAASQLAVRNSGHDSIEMKTMKTQVADARNESIKVIETEIPIIIKDLEEYNQDINLISENINLLEENLAPIKGAISKFNTTISVITGVNNFVDVPFVSKMENELAFAQSRLEEIDTLLLQMENLKVIQKEMNDSHQTLNSLYEEYQKEKSIKKLLLIEQELNSNFIYQIEELRNLTVDAQEVFVLSSNILTTVNNAKSFFDSAQEKGGAALDVIQFWKDNKEAIDTETNIKEGLKKDLEASKEEIQNLPNELAERSKDSISSINKVQKELQTLRIAQMVIGE